MISRNKIVYLPAFKHGARLARWSSTSLSPVLAVGMQHGEVWIFTVNAKKCYKISVFQGKKDCEIRQLLLWNFSEESYIVCE